jgi:hypothetical protein
LRPFKQSTVATIRIGPCLDSAGAEYTGLVIGDLTLTKAGTSAAMAAGATLTHITNGHYSLVTITGNTDTLGTLRIDCNKATYQIPPVEGEVLPATVYDALVTNATNVTGGLVAATAAVSAAAGYIGSSGAAVNGTNANTLSSHDPGATIGTSTLTQSQVTGGAYTVQSSSCVLGDGRVANLDAAVTSRMATYTQPTGFLAATFPGTVASTTNITGGTITTVTNLTNAPSAGDLTSTMKTSVENAVWNASMSSHQTAGTMGYAASEIDTIYGTAYDGIHGAMYANMTYGNGVAFATAVSTPLTAIKAKTDNLPASPAATGDAMALTSGERNSTADAILSRAVSNVESSADSHSLATVILAATEWAIDGTAWHVYRTDGSTLFVDKTLTTNTDGHVTAVT